MITNILSTYCPALTHISQSSPPMVVSWNSSNCPLTKRSTRLDLPTAMSPSSTNLNWQILVCGSVPLERPPLPLELIPARVGDGRGAGRPPWSRATCTAFQTECSQVSLLVSLPPLTPCFVWRKKWEVCLVFFLVQDYIMACLKATKALFLGPSIKPKDYMFNEEGWRSDMNSRNKKTSFHCTCITLHLPALDVFCCHNLPCLTHTNTLFFLSQGKSNPVLYTHRLWRVRVLWGRADISLAWNQRIASLPCFTFPSPACLFYLLNQSHVWKYCPSSAVSQYPAVKLELTGMLRLKLLSPTS